VEERCRRMLYLLKVEVNYKIKDSLFCYLKIKINNSGGESEQLATPMDIHGSGNANEQHDTQSKTNDANSTPNISQSLKKTYITPKIWMDFDDFCACFTSIVVYHNPRGYQFTHKHTEVKVKYLKLNLKSCLCLSLLPRKYHFEMHILSSKICISFSFLHHNR